MPAMYLISVAATGLDDAPLPGQPMPDGTQFAVAERDFGQIPPLRRWLDARGIAIRTESGHAGPASMIRDQDLYVVLAPTSLSARVTGISRTRDPCPRCGLGTARLHAGPSPVVEHALPSRPLVSVMGTSWFLADGLMGLLEDADMSEGLERTQATFSDGMAWAVWGQRELVGLGYPYGPDPCPVCRRASRKVDGELEFVAPRFGLSLTVPRQQGQGWWWHAVQGQAVPVVSGEVVTALRAAEVDLTAVWLAPEGATEAFLPEEYR
jgi:hypothetical protein